MAKNNNLNIVEQEKLKKAKEQRSKEKLERLSQVDPKRLKKRIADLEGKKSRNNGRLLINEQRQLDSLLKDLEYINRKNLVKEDEPEPEHKESKPIELGLKSLQNVTYPLKTPFEHEIDPQVETIPIPNSPPPRFFKIQQAQSTYESAPEVKLLSAASTKFIPSTIRNKTVKIQKETEDNEDDDDENEMKEYASEEEEYLRKRKADELE
ncbi:unnamed protein product [Wickerhamomyces anomalus]